MSLIKVVFSQLNATFIFRLPKSSYCKSCAEREIERERNRLLTSALFNHLHLFGIVMSSKCMSYVIKRNIFLLECFKCFEWRDFNFVFSSKHLNNAFSWNYITTRYKESIDYSAIFKIGHSIKRILKMF